jgi:hypothetical protein
MIGAVYRQGRLVVVAKLVVVDKTRHTRTQQAK